MQQKLARLQAAQRTNKLESFPTAGKAARSVKASASEEWSPEAKSLAQAWAGVKPSAKVWGRRKSPTEKAAEPWPVEPRGVGEAVNPGEAWRG
jgi:hypothetical protein